MSKHPQEIEELYQQLEESTRILEGFQMAASPYAMGNMKQLEHAIEENKRLLLAR